jgi:hypothetical protein
MIKKKPNKYKKTKNKKSKYIKSLNINIKEKLSTEFKKIKYLDLNKNK